MVKVIHQTNPHLPFRMSRDRQPRLPIDIPLTQIHIALRTRIDNLNICALLFACPDVRGDDDERVGVSLVPDTLFGWVVIGG